MTPTKAPETAPAASSRPKRPPPSGFAVGGAILAVLITIAAAADWEYGVAFSIGDVFENLTARNVAVEGLLNLDWTRFTSETVRQGFIETAQMATIASIIGALIGLPLALLNSVVGAPNKVTFAIIKTFNSLVRAVPDILLATFFVAVIGGGALSGMIALLIFSIGVVAKLTADVIDGIDMGPVEAAKASGASHFQVVRVAVLPQVIPAWTSFSLYTFEINLRGSAVLGFVGAGGIGELLNAYRGRGQYDRVWGVVVGFFVVVYVMDRISVALRKRLR